MDVPTYYNRLAYSRQNCPNWNWSNVLHGGEMNGNHVFMPGVPGSMRTCSPADFALKSMLVLRPNLRVDSMFSVIFEMFLPKYIKQHLDRNVDTWDGRQFKRKVFPPEFGKRPLCVLEGLQARKSRAEKIPTCKIDSTHAASGLYRFTKNESILKAEYMLHRAKSTSTSGMQAIRNC